MPLFLDFTFFFDTDRLVRGADSDAESMSEKLDKVFNSENDSVLAISFVRLVGSWCETGCRFRFKFLTDSITDDSLSEETEEVVFDRSFEDSSVKSVDEILNISDLVESDSESVSSEVVSEFDSELEFKTIVDSESDDDDDDERLSMSVLGCVSKPK